MAMFKLGIPDYISLETENDKFLLKGEGRVFDFGNTKLEYLDENVYLTSTEEPRLLRLRWNYKLDKESRILGDAFERTYGDMEWQNISARRYMPWYFLAKSNSDIKCFGVKVLPSAMCYWQVDTKGISLYLDVRCGNTGVRLNGRRLALANIVCMSDKDKYSFDVAREFCTKMCDKAVLPSFPIYGSNNWYYAYGDSSAGQILKDTDYILKLTKNTKNPPFMVIDDCWQENHRLDEYNGGPWTKGNSKFPDMADLASKLKAKGVRAGIWVRLLLNEDNKIKDEWRLSNTKCLDPTHPAALDYIKKDIERICDWGYTLIKHDFSTFDIFERWGFEASLLNNTEEKWHFYDISMTSAEAVKLLYKSIYEASRKNDAIIIGCNTIGHLGAGYMHVNRTGDDTSGRMWERTRRMGVNTLAFRLPQHGIFYHIDADCIGVYKGISWEKNKQWARVLAESGTPLFASIKPDILSPEQEKEMQDIMLIASEQNIHKIPLDWEITDCPEIWAEGDDVSEYDWYEEEGVNMPASVEKFFAPLAIP